MLRNQRALRRDRRALPCAASLGEGWGGWAALISGSCTSSVLVLRQQGTKLALSLTGYRKPHTFTPEAASDINIQCPHHILLHSFTYSLNKHVLREPLVSQCARPWDHHDEEDIDLMLTDSRTCCPQNMSLWDGGYFELQALGKEQMQGGAFSVPYSTGPQSHDRSSTSLVPLGSFIPWERLALVTGGVTRSRRHTQTDHHKPSDLHS